MIQFESFLDGTDGRVWEPLECHLTILIFIWSLRCVEEVFLASFRVDRTLFLDP